MTKKIILFTIILSVTGAHAFAALAEGEWFLSNKAGMLLTKTTKTRALHSAHSIQLHRVNPADVPREIRKYYSAPWRIECRILYAGTKRERTQWVYKDIDEKTFFIASIANDGSGFLEWYDDKGYVVEEQRLNTDGSGLFISYTYNDIYLIKVEAVNVEAAIKKDESPAAEDDEAPPPGITPPADEAPGTPPAGAESEPVTPLSQEMRHPQGPVEIPAFYVAVTGRESGTAWVDNYRYTRANTLRAIERAFKTGAEHGTERRISFPRITLGSDQDKEFVRPQDNYSSSFLDIAGQDEAARITFSLDAKSRIISETRYDSEDKLIGELTNTWKNDRIEKTVLKTDDGERVVEYAYDKNGDRVSEKDYKDGILERTVEKAPEGDEETETLYLDNAPVLRAIWQDGKKISETRLLN